MAMGSKTNSFNSSLIQQGNKVFYSVKPNDTLWGLVENLQEEGLLTSTQSVDKAISALTINNHLFNANTIYPEQQLDLTSILNTAHLPAQLAQKNAEQAQKTKAAQDLQRQEAQQQKQRLEAQAIEQEANSIRNALNGFTISEKLTQERAKYNLSVKNKAPDPSQFNDYLPLRKWLTQHDPSKLAAYDAQVEKVLKTAKFYTTDGSIDDGEKNLQQMEDDSTKYLIAARSVVEKYFYRPDVIDASVSRQQTGFLSPLKKLLGMQEKTEPLRFVLYNNPKGDMGGYFTDEKFTIALQADAYWSTLTNPNDGDDVGSHEFDHNVDARDGKGDGLLGLVLTRQQQNRMKAIQKELSAENKRQDPDFDYNRPVKDGAYWNTETALGLKRYAFKNEREFLTVFGEAWGEENSTLESNPLLRELSNIYKIQLGFDPSQL